MTEITVDTVEIGERQVRWLAFIAALIASPITVAILGFWAIVPIFAALLGAPTYMLFGAPAFYLAIRSGKKRVHHFLTAGLLAHLVSLPAFALYANLTSAGADLLEMIFFFGCVFAPIWGLVFGLYYCTFAPRPAEVV